MLAEQYVFFIIISILGLGGTLFLMGMKQKREPYFTDTWYIVCVIGWFICYITSMVGLCLTQ